jgi:predicted Abi (CAAX) family protease
MTKKTPLFNSMLSALTETENQKLQSRCRARSGKRTKAQTPVPLSSPVRNSDRKLPTKKHAKKQKCQTPPASLAMVSKKPEQ